MIVVKFAGSNPARGSEGVAFRYTNNRRARAMTAKIVCSIHDIRSEGREMVAAAPPTINFHFHEDENGKVTFTYDPTATDNGEASTPEARKLDVCEQDYDLFHEKILNPFLKHMRRTEEYAAKQDGDWKEPAPEIETDGSILTALGEGREMNPNGHPIVETMAVLTGHTDAQDDEDDPDETAANEHATAASLGLGQDDEWDDDDDEPEDDGDDQEDEDDQEEEDQEEEEDVFAPKPKKVAPPVVKPAGVKKPQGVTVHPANGYDGLSALPKDHIPSAKEKDARTQAIRAWGDKNARRLKIQLNAPLVGGKGRFSNRIVDAFYNAHPDLVRW